MSRRAGAVRAAWMLEVERLAVAQRPDLAGRIDWDSAAYFFNTFMKPDEAANRLAFRQPTGETNNG